MLVFRYLQYCLGVRWLFLVGVKGGNGKEGEREWISAPKIKHFCHHQRNPAMDEASTRSLDYWEQFSKDPLSPSSRTHDNVWDHLWLSQFREEISTGTSWIEVRDPESTYNVEKNPTQQNMVQATMPIMPSWETLSIGHFKRDLVEKIPVSGGSLR